MVRKKTKTIAILLILAIFGVIAVIGLFQNQLQSSPIEAKDYFQVVDAGVIDGKVEEDGNVWILYGISVTFKAVRGNAHDVVVQSWAGAEAQEIGDMLKDSPKTVSLFSPQSSFGGGYLSRKQVEGFPVEIRITSSETSGSGKVKFFLSG